MPALNASVYLNESDDRLARYTSELPTRLRTAGSFEIEVDGDLTGADQVRAARELVYTELNIGDPTATWALLYRLAGMRSFSVGDVVVIGETAWLCAEIGWKTLTGDQLRAAITAP